MPIIIIWIKAMDPKRRWEILLEEEPYMENRKTKISCRSRLITSICWRLLRRLSIKLSKRCIKEISLMKILKKPRNIIIMPEETGDFNSKILWTKEILEKTPAKNYLVELKFSNSKIRRHMCTERPSWSTSVTSESTSKTIKRSN